jgi:tRNA(fMet)-specific endonuclease VapC
MMRYLLDTNIVIALLNDVDSAVGRRARQQYSGDVAISAIVAHELYYGAFKSKRKDRNLAVVDALQFTVLEFDREDARRAGEVRAVLADKGAPIGPYDALIAGQALSRDLVLVTSNTREFGRVPELRIEDWQAIG